MKNEGKARMKKEEEEEEEAAEEDKKIRTKSLSVAVELRTVRWARCC